MATLQAKRIKDALQKFRKVGRIEDTTQIAGCDVTFTNLTQTEFEAAFAAMEGLTDVAYANAYQMEQVCRSIIEIDGQDLRDVDYIEDEVPVGHYVVELALPNKAAADSVAAKLREQKLTVSITQQTTDQTKTVKVERQQWLKTNVLETWGREAITVAWRKFTEMSLKADDHAKKGVHFMVPDEQPEDRFRRLLDELREAESELPDELVNAVLSDAGLLKKARREELEAAHAKLTQVGEAQPSPEPVAPPPPTPVTPPSPPVERVAPGAPPLSVQQAMLNRQRLNQQSIDVPVPVPAPEAVPVPAVPRVVVPPQIRKAAAQNAQNLQGNEPSMNARASEIAALESLDAGTPALEVHRLPGRQDDAVIDLSHPQTGIDAKGLHGIIDRPPVAGINPRFRPRN